jgi:hypothetical protein
VNIRLRVRWELGEFVRPETCPSIGGGGVQSHHQQDLPWKVLLKSGEHSAVIPLQQDLELLYIDLYD